MDGLGPAQVQLAQQEGQFIEVADPENTIAAMVVPLSRETTILKALYPQHEHDFVVNTSRLI